MNRNLLKVPKSTVMHVPSEYRQCEFFACLPLQMQKGYQEGKYKNGSHRLVVSDAFKMTQALGLPDPGVDVQS